MSVEDPFFVVKSEVEKSVNSCHELQHKLQNLLNGYRNGTKSEYQSIANELRNNLRSIEWDLEDLDETIGIVHANPHKFNITDGELQERNHFISSTRKDIQQMKSELTENLSNPRLENLSRKSLLANGHNRNVTSNGYGSQKPTGFQNVDDHSKLLEDTQQRQQLLIEQQDDQLDMVADSVGILKNMSRSIGDELDEQSVMLDGLGTDIENTQSRMDSVLRKMAKVTHMSNDRRQWCAIGILGGTMFLVFLLFFILP